MDRARFDAFYEEMRKPLWAYLYRSTGSEAMADDILQDAFIKFLENPPDKKAKSSMKSYLYTIASRLTKDHFRDQQRRRKYFDQENYETEPEARSHGELELSADVQAVFDRLKQRERTLLWLAYVEGYKHKEIAEILDLKKDSIRVLLYRARNHMSELLEEVDLQPEDLL